MVSCLNVEFREPSEAKFTLGSETLASWYIRNVQLRNCTSFSTVQIYRPPELSYHISVSVEIWGGKEEGRIYGLNYGVAE